MRSRRRTAAGRARGSRRIATTPFTINGTVAWTPYRRNTAAQVLGGVAGAALFVTGGTVLVRRSRRQQPALPTTTGTGSRPTDRVLSGSR